MKSIITILILIISSLTFYNSILSVETEYINFDLYEMVLVNSNPTLINHNFLEKVEMIPQMCVSANHRLIKLDSKTIDTNFKPFSIHDNKYIDVFVNKIGYNEFNKFDNLNFPIGTKIVKKKYLDYENNKEAVELFTTMTKINYSDTVKIDNWLFQILDSNMQVIKEDVSRCIDCHSKPKYIPTDFVTRENYWRKFNPPKLNLIESKKD